MQINRERIHGDHFARVGTNKCCSSWRQTFRIGNPWSFGRKVRANRQCGPRVQFLADKRDCYLWLQAEGVPTQVDKIIPVRLLRDGKAIAERCQWVRCVLRSHKVKTALERHRLLFHLVHNLTKIGSD